VQGTTSVTTMVATSPAGAAPGESKQTDAVFITFISQIGRDSCFTAHVLTGPIPQGGLKRSRIDRDARSALSNPNVIGAKISRFKGIPAGLKPPSGKLQLLNNHMHVGMCRSTMWHNNIPR
jgi:hypothetical protein